MIRAGRHRGKAKAFVKHSPRRDSLGCLSWELTALPRRQPDQRTTSRANQRAIFFIRIAFEAITAAPSLLRGSGRRPCHTRHQASPTIHLHLYSQSVDVIFRRARLERHSGVDALHNPGQDPQSAHLRRQSDAAGSFMRRASRLLVCQRDRGDQMSWVRQRGGELARHWV